MKKTIQITMTETDGLMARTATGHVVDIGLPEGETALMHKGASGACKWVVSHVESGGALGGGETRDMALLNARGRVLAAGTSNTIKAVAKGRKQAAAYRKRLWTEAAVKQQGNKE